MNRIFAAAVTAFALCWSVPAQAQIPGQPLTFLGYCQLTSIDASAALASCSGGIPAGTNAIIVRVEAQAVRYRPDGATSAPTTTVGMPIAITDPPLYIQAGIGAFDAYRFISQTSGGKLDVLFYAAPQ